MVAGTAEADATTCVDMGRPISAFSLAALALLVPVPAHGGSSSAVTSDYRVELSGVAPSASGLSVDVVDVDGTLELTWNGDGAVVVDGYDGEPYLRIDADGVERNIHSPATYLNQNRYARVDMPATADSSAAPEWEQISSGRSVRWHDHRTHWMDVTPPLVVRNDPSDTHVIIDHWTLPITVDGHAASIDGRLLWVPPPSTAPWWALAVGVCAVVLGLLMTRWWRGVAVVAASIGTVVFAVDGFGFLARNTHGVVPWVWAIGWPALAVGLTVALARQLRAHRDRVPIMMAAVGVVIAVLGGIDRVDSISHSQVFSALPDWASRAAAATSLGIGIALVLRVLVDVVPTLITGRRRPVSAEAELASA